MKPAIILDVSYMGLEITCDTNEDDQLLNPNGRQCTPPRLAHTRTRYIRRCNLPPETSKCTQAAVQQ